MSDRVPSSPQDFRWALSTTTSDLIRLVGMATDLLEEAAQSPLQLDRELAELEKLEGPVQRLTYLLSSLTSRRDASEAQRQGTSPRTKRRRTLVPTSEPTEPGSPPKRKRTADSSLDSAPAPVIQGNHLSMPMAVLFEFLASTRKTGCLHVRTAKEELLFDFIEGEAVFGTPRDAPGIKRFCDALVRSGLLRDADLQAFLRRNAGSQVPLGDAMVSWRLINKEQLLTVLSTLAQSDYDLAESATPSTFAFWDKAVKVPGTRLRVPARRLALQHARVHDSKPRA